MLHSQEEAGFENEIARFKKRLGAIVDGPADRWQKQFKDGPTTKPLADLLKEFDLFARNYFAYFTRGEPTTSLLCDLNTALGRLQREWAVISRACEQREIPEFNKALEKASEQARKYYDRFHGYKATDLPPIPYFEKLYTITRSPFMPYPALTSIPLQVFNDPTQWRGMAHELGHYIYWNSPELSKDPKYQEVQSRLENAVLKALSVSPENYDDFQRRARLVDIWMRWQEELFADICGTLLAGPLYVFSGQRRVEETAVTITELSKDDGVHPLPYLRPLIGLETLAWVAEQLDNNSQKTGLEAIITFLRERWAEPRRKGRRGKTYETIGLKISEIEDSITVVVQALLEGSKGGDGPGTWVGADGQPADLGQLIDYKPWLDDLPEVEAALSTKPTSVQVALDRIDLVPESSPFEDLVEYFEGKFEKPKEVREAMLSLEMEERRYGCQKICAKYVGSGGNYERVACTDDCV